MTFTKIISFTAPKTAGSSVISLSSAILRQFNNPAKRIAFLQITSFPDIHLLAGVSDKHSIFDAKLFLEAGEFSPEILDKIKANQGVDIYLSPNKKAWEDFNEELFTRFLARLKNAYEEIYIDLNHSAPEKIKQQVQQVSTQMILVSNLDPLSLSTTKQYLDNFPRKNDVALIINQCNVKNLVEKWIEKLSVNLLAVLPSDEKAVWRNVFEGFPVAFNKHSKLRKGLNRLLEDLNK